MENENEKLKQEAERAARALRDIIGKIETVMEDLTLFYDKEARLSSLKNLSAKVSFSMQDAEGDLQPYGAIGYDEKDDIIDVLYQVERSRAIKRLEFLNELTEQYLEAKLKTVELIQASLLEAPKALKKAPKEPVKNPLDDIKPYVSDDIPF